MEHLKPTNINVLILAGGKSSRFNYKSKSLLIYNNKTFIKNIYDTFEQFNIYISLLKNSHSELDKLGDLKIDYKNLIFDKQEDIGPIGAIYSAFLETKSDYIFVCCTDVPLISKELVMYLYSFINIHKNKSIISSLEDRLHPCFGIYHKNILPTLIKQIDNKDYKMHNLLKKINFKQINLSNTLFKNQLLNINTQDDYKKITPSSPFVFCVSGFKNSGKTTLICRLLPLFLKDDFKVAILKHDGHDYDLNTFNTDSAKYSIAGAQDITIYSKTKYTTTQFSNFLLDEFISNKSNYDFIIIEGLKNEKYPKIELIRNKSITKSELFNVMFCVSDFTISNKKTYNFEQIKEIYINIKKEKYERQL